MGGDVIDQRQLKNSIRMARKTFRYFWREMFWDSQRPEPLCSYAAVLCNFGEMQGDQQVNEKLWLTNIICDGTNIHGVVERPPQLLTSIHEGGGYMVPINGIDDWMYVIHGRAYGAYSINLLRAQMDPQARLFHDQAWGFDFGNPNVVSMFPRAEAFLTEEEPESDDEEEEEAEEPKKFLGITLSSPKKKNNGPKKFLGVTVSKTPKKDTGPTLSEQLGLAKVNLDEVDQIKNHPLALEYEDTIIEQLRTNPNLVHEVNQMGWSLLHSHALAGSRNIIQELLTLGADPHALTPDGKSARMLAKSLAWRDTMATLSEAERKNKLQF